MLPSSSISIQQQHIYIYKNTRTKRACRDDRSEGDSLPYIHKGMKRNQLGPQQLKYMTVLRDSSDCLSLSAVSTLKAAESKALEKRLV